MKTLLLGVSAATITVLTGLVIPGMTQTQTTVETLRSNNIVTLSGEVVRLMGDDFLLDDGTGQIEVDAETSAMREAAISVSTTVTVTGYYDDNEFEALTLTPNGGETITVLDD